MRSNASAIGQRRGQRTTKASSSSSHWIVILLALCATIFVLGLVVGTRILGTPSIDGSSSTTTTTKHKNAEISPLSAAVASRVAPSDINNLILESAKAEVVERRENLLERRKHQQLDPGDVNYNPHHRVDDVLEDYGSDQGEKIINNDELKLKNKIEENRINRGIQNLKQRAMDISHGLLRGRGGSDGKDNIMLMKNSVADKTKDTVKKQTTDEDESNGIRYYPYMMAAVPKDYDFQRYEPLGGSRYVEYKDGDSPYDITDVISRQSDELARSRRYHVLGAMKHIWKSYKDRAFGKDELKPISGDSNNRWGGMGTTLVDSLDTLWLMGLKDEFWEARDWIRDQLVFDTVAGEDRVHGVSFFETTIRSLGGLLAAYDLSRDEAFLTKADDLGSRLVKAYDTPSGLPHSSINIHDGRANDDIGCLADVGTEQIEFRFLARATGKRNYADKTEKAFEQLRKLQPSDGLLFQDLQDGGGNPFFSGDKVSFGAMGDSTYEYMLKIWIQGGRKENKYREMWDKAMSGMHEQLLQKSSPNGLTYIADRYGDARLDRKMDHLVCFMGGSLALSAYTDPQGLNSPRAQRDLKAARAITYTCYQMYARTKSGLAPEFYTFEGDNDMIVSRNAPFYILRPEAVEAFYYLSKLTGDPIYREWGWEIFQSIEKYCKVNHGYASMHNVDNSNSQDDRMESFFMAETLKYLYLLFDPDSEIDILNKHVFNTEAHPLQIFDDQ
jgi:mannosyl-oligosaccharide alpha-1,2-mannosidase